MTRCNHAAPQRNWRECWNFLVLARYFARQQDYEVVNLALVHAIRALRGCRIFLGENKNQ